MPPATALPPLPVAGPLAVAGILLAIGKWLPRRVPDTVGILTALAAAAICAMLLRASAEAPVVTWFGGWIPGGGQVIGIAFAVDQAGAAFGTFIGLLFAATLIFSWGYFDETHAHFHTLMLLFMAGMIGFCLTHDLFNMFVWFEVMSVAGFAVTGYQLRASPLEGALNFTVVNTIGSYLFLGGLGLLYAVGGALDMSALGQVVAHMPNDPVVAAAFVLMASGLLVKSAQVPFHLWLSDAHAVAPSPVSVIFSGAMVAIGVFGLSRLVFIVFAGSPPVLHVVHTALLGMGAASAVLGAVLALLQRHLKRMLAFSTVSHTGLQLIGLALTSRDGAAGMLLYMAGHGLVKGALFMVVGILLALRGDVDELRLRGRGGALWPVGLAMAVGGLLLAGLPFGLMDDGYGLIGAAARDGARGWVVATMVVSGAGTGAAVLRSAGRIFLGLGPLADEQRQAATDEEQETSDRPLWLMLVPVIVMLVAAVALSEPARALAWRAAGMLMLPDPARIMGGAAQFPPPAPPDAPLANLYAWLPTGLAVLLASSALLPRSPANPVAVASRLIVRPVARGLEFLHSGAIGDYIAWLAIGVAILASAFALG
jgi:multicomponent Na+:H+ antiporter subunit D